MTQSKIENWEDLPRAHEVKVILTATEWAYLIQSIRSNYSLPPDLCIVNHEIADALERAFNSSRGEN